MKWLRFAPLLLLVLALGAMAQVGVYGEFSAAKINRPNTDWIYGPTLGAYYDPWHVPFLGAGIDLRAAFLGTGSTTLDSGLAGPRLVFIPHALPFQPYAEALIGVGHTRFGQGIAKQTNTDFEYQFLGGLDITILPRIDWRVVEFSYGGVSGLGRSLDPKMGSSLNPKTISTGLVVRLP